MYGFSFENMKDSLGMNEICAAHDKTLSLLYAKNFFTERVICKRRMVGEENST